MKASKAVRQFLAEAGRKGAKRRTESLTPERRSAIAKSAVAARWRKESSRDDTQT